jgi:methylenetetrahydrofolate dehydrogenase (NADP+)/methenyltetrahydrofolate cyclohydrolase/formyltetrahydrofolate synthetase
MHGGGPSVVPGLPLKDEYTQENLALVKDGMCNLIRHIENGKKFGVPVVVAINTHKNDTPAEHELIKSAALENGAFACVTANHWAEGGKGAVDLANALIEACEQKSDFKFLYDVELSIEEKINKIAKEMYGAGNVDFAQKVRETMRLYAEKGYSKLPICMAKTSASLTGDPNIKGAPNGFRIFVNDMFLSAGAGFIVPMVGEISRMPGLPTRPAIFDIDLNTETGEIIGLF